VLGVLHGSAIVCYPRREGGQAPPCSSSRRALARGCDVCHPGGAPTFIPSRQSSRTRTRRATSQWQLVAGQQIPAFPGRPNVKTRWGHERYSHPQYPLLNSIASSPTPPLDLQLPCPSSSDGREAQRPETQALEDSGAPLVGCVPSPRWQPARALARFLQAADSCCSAARQARS
jgi:hypothetical protein